MLPAEIAPLPPPPTAEAPTQELGREDFLRMLIAQLENQDPLNPQDATEFTAQLAQFSSLEQLIAMRTAVDALAEVQASSSGLAGVGLVGRQVLVEGSQFSVEESAALPTLFLDLPETAPVANVEIVRLEGGVVASTGDLGVLPAGLRQLDWAEFGGAPPPGVYALRVSQSVSTGAPPTPLVQARVTGASVGGSDPTLFLGEAAAPLSALREVRE